MITKENKKKIARVLELTMEIEGASFDFHPSSDTLSVFTLNTEGYNISLTAIMTDWCEQNNFKTIDSLIKDLENHITIKNLEQCNEK